MPVHSVPVHHVDTVHRGIVGGGAEQGGRPGSNVAPQVGLLLPELSSVNFSPGPGPGPCPGPAPGSFCIARLTFDDMLWPKKTPEEVYLRYN